MNNSAFKIVAGFVILFLLYHAAEYMILFKNSAVGFLAFQALFFFAAFLIGKWQTGQGLASWGLDFRKGAIIQLIAGMMMGIILYGGCYLISLATDAERLIQTPQLSATWRPLALFVFGNFFSSLSEDVLTRGYVYRHLKGKTPVIVIVIFSAFVYLVNHIYRLEDGPSAWIYLLALGLIFIVPLVVTGRLWFTGGMHWAGNCIFFYTHEIMNTTTGDSSVSFNFLLVGCIALLVPFVYSVAAFFRRRFE